MATDMLYREHKRRLEELYALRRRVNDEIAAEKRAITTAFPATVKTNGRRRVAQCGTDGGYFHHLRTLRNRPCIPCKRAHAAVERERSRRVRATAAEVATELGPEAGRASPYIEESA